MSGQFGTSLNNPNQHEIVETYHDNSGNWYRLYSDGWCDQGGIYNNQKASGNFNATVNFLKPLSRNEGKGYPSIIVTDSGSSNNNSRICSIKDVSETNFLLMSNYAWARDNTSQFAMWRANGYVL